MRLLILSVSASCAVSFAAMCASAQTGQWGEGQDQTTPYNTHVDRRHGNDHVYPDRGAVIRDIPHRATGINYAGISYRFAGGVWYQKLGPAYMVVTPPIGVMVPQLPPFATRFDSAGKTYLYANDVFYSPRPDLGGYEVVNDPQDGAPGQALTPPSPSVVAVGSATAPQPPTQPAPAEQPENDLASPVAPADAVSDASVPSNPTGVAISPRNGQSEDQQAVDRYECYRFAVSQTGFDPIATNSAAPPAEIAREDPDYARAQAACLEGRGYTLP